MLVLAPAGCSNEGTQVNKQAAGDIAALQHRLSELQVETQRLEDIKAIKNLQRAYGYYVPICLLTMPALSLPKGASIRGRTESGNFFTSWGMTKPG